MSYMFSNLQKVKEEQTETLNKFTPLSAKEAKKQSGRDAQKPAQNIEQVSKAVSKPLSKALSNGLSQEAVEELAFRLRRTPQAKLNANVPIGWKDKLDDLAYQLKVGKYELVTYIVGVFLGEVEPPKT